MQKRQAAHGTIACCNRTESATVRGELMSRDMDQNGPPSDGTESGRARLLPARSGFSPVEAPIPTTTLAVDHIGEADRFAYWREQWCQGTAGVTGELAPGERHSFYARATVWTFPWVIRARLRTGPF